MTMMSGISDLKALLKSMEPKRANGDFVVFCTVPEKNLPGISAKPRLIFREKEGVTVILEKKDADANSLSYDGVWAEITLNVHSSLNAVGFLAVITRALAEAKISVNAVSAYYHDHIFVPGEKAQEAMQVLKRLQN